MISDGSSTHTGTYHITLLHLSSPGSSYLGNLLSGQTQSGNINAIPGMNVFHFKGQRRPVLAAVTTTSGDLAVPISPCFPQIPGITKKLPVPMAAIPRRWMIS